MEHHQRAAPVYRRGGEGRQLTLITDTVTVTAATADTGGVYALYELVTPPGGGCPPHSQRYDDVTLVVIEGTYTVLIGDESVDLGPGGYVLVPRGTTHGYANAGNTPARMLMLVTPGSIHEQFLDDAGDAADRPAWEPDMARILSVAPKYGIEFQSVESVQPEPALRS